jgi:hypothetical protein
MGNMRLTCEGFSQEYLVRLNLTTSDAYVLRWFLSFINSGKQLHIDINGERYYWIKYSKVISDLPILKIKNNIVIGNLFRKLCGQGKPNEYEYPLEKRNTWDSKTNKVFFRFRPEVLEKMENTTMNSLFSESPIQQKQIVKDKNYHKIPYNKNVYEIYEKLKTMKENDKRLFVNHITPADDHHYNSTFEHFQNAMLCLYEGRFLTTYNLGKLNDWFRNKFKYYLNEKDIQNKIRECKGSWANIHNLIIEAAKNYSKWFDIDTEQYNKSNLPRSINNWIYSVHNKTSMFYVSLLYPPTSAREADAEKTFRSIRPEYRKIFTSIYKEEWDGFTFWNKISSLIKWYNKYQNNLVGNDSNCIYWFDSGLIGFLNNYKEWLLDFTNNKPFLKNIGIANNTFDLYIKQKIKDHDIEIEIPRSL